jgi:hypothetical protein
MATRQLPADVRYKGFDHGEGPNTAAWVHFTGNILTPEHIEKAHKLVVEKFCRSLNTRFYIPV